MNTYEERNHEINRENKYRNSPTYIPYYYHTYIIGLVTAITDTNRKLEEQINYNFYGMPTITDFQTDPTILSQISGSLIGNDIMFQGRQYDKEPNLYYYRARYYDPKKGHFLQTDPMGYTDSMNLYQSFNQNSDKFTAPYMWRKK